MNDDLDADTPTTRLPVFGEFFTWAPGDEPAPYAPPPPARPQPPPNPPPHARGGTILDRLEPPPPDRRGRRRWLTVIPAAAALIAVAVVLWPARHPTGNHTTPPTQAHPPTATVTETRQLNPHLASLLPPGYPPDTCSSAPTSAGAVAAQCGPNTEAPNTAAQFTLYPDDAALAAALDRALRDTTILVCPGGYQSPGPWRRNAEPTVAVGTLVCGTGPRGRPRVAWTLDRERLLATIESNLNGPTLAELYNWWTMHS